MQQRPQRWLIYLSLILLVVSCGEPVPVDCTPDEEQCTTETEGGFETGPVAGIAAGGATVVAIAAGGLGGGEGGGSSSSSSNGANNTNQNTPTLTGTLLDSAVGGVTYSTTSDLSGLTSNNGHFQYRSGDQVTFSIGDTVLGKVNGGALITPVELAGTNNTADRRVINISRLLQSLDQDGNPANGISVNPATRAMLAQQPFKFDIPVTEFQLKVNPFIENILKRPIVNADEAINHLHSSLNSEGRPGSIGSQDDIRQLVPGFVAVTPDNAPPDPPSNPTQVKCNFAGGSVPDGGSVIAYQSTNVAAGELCSSQTRFCNNGLLSGSYAYMSCQVQEATDCQFNGNSIANGTSVTTYQSLTVPFGQSCQLEQRFCTNGVLGGTYPFQTCSEAGPSSCTFDGSDVPHGGVVTAFLADSVSSEGSCNSQVRSCFNGVLSGTYGHGSCAVKQAQSCSFNGQIINDGQSVSAYLSKSVPFGSNCISETRNCNDGFLSGNYAFDSCAVAVAASCDFNGQNIQSGSSITAYQAASVSYGNSCVAENRGCSNGALSSSYNNSSCSVSEAASCNFNDQTVQSGSSVTAYQSASVSYGNSCVSENRACSAGTLNGSYSHSSCSVVEAASCSFNGQTVAHNSSVAAYQASSVPYGDTCISENRNCSNGTLSGIYTNSNCSKRTWTKQLVTSSWDYGYGITSDSSGNLYVTGSTGGSLDGNTSAGSGDLFVVKYNSSGVKQWTKQLGTSDNDLGEGITSDSSGNVYVTGRTEGGGLDGNTSAGSDDLFVVNYNSSGVKQWTKQLGTSTYDQGYGITSDSSGNVYVTGHTNGNLDGNTSAGGLDLLVVKYNSSGTKQWTKQLGTSASEYAFDITSDSSGNVYVTGETGGGLDGNTSAGSSDIFAVKYNSSGVKQWTKQLGTSVSDQGLGITSDSSGNIYVTGYTSAGLDGNANAGGADIFVVKYNSTGVKQWTQQLGTSSSDLGRGITSDSSGNVYVTGDTYGGLDGNTNDGDADLFVVKYNSSGVKQWTQQLGTSESDIGYGITSDSSGNVYVTGNTRGDLDGNTSAGNYDIFVVKYNSDGVKQ